MVAGALLAPPGALGAGEGLLSGASRPDPQGGSAHVSERIYEVLFIVDPNIAEAEVDALAAQVQGFIEREKGKVQKVEKWGKKRLAYLVKKHREGQYVLITADVDAAAIK